MNAYQASQLARGLMKQHGIGDWIFLFGRGKVQLGSCNHIKRTIKLSRVLVEMNEEADIRNTILHEIAHALTGQDAKSHGALWKRTAQRIGARPERCYRDHIKKPEGRWHLECDLCGFMIDFHRRPRRGREAVYKHKGCKGRIRLQLPSAIAASMPTEVRKGKP